MQHKISNTVTRIAKKELTLFFSSPVAYLFIAAFVGITLFIFFFGEKFFARNIADVRPLFEWMPVLLIFLCSTLTMRLWSEERRVGTLEHVLTQSVPIWHFVLGKFAACKFLLFVALLLTLPLPITISMIADIDWGPVFAGYLAAMFLGSAYIAIGLAVSSRTDNQIVSLIGSVAVCGFFYLLGAPLVTNFFGTGVAELLRDLGTGSRFSSITRGVIDARDLLYYLSLFAIFFFLNVYFLEKERWAGKRASSIDTSDGVNTKAQRHRNWNLAAILIVANALVLNIWFANVERARFDLTEGNQYSISAATDNTLATLQEPLLIRGYFSAKTHPLLAPLVPQVKDLLEEYEIAGGRKIEVEFVDPVTNPELEEEANQRYGIRPTPFQVADRYQNAIVNSYFNILLRYGDQSEVLGFQDLIEVKSQNESSLDVQLRNPEYAFTSAIKKLVKSYQSAGNVFDTLDTAVTLNAYVSADSRIPEQLIEFRDTVRQTAQKAAEESSGKLSVNFIDPDANGGEVARQIAEDYGFQPMATSFLSSDRFYFYITLTDNNQILQIPLEDLSKETFEKNFDAALKRFASGFTKTVGLVKPKAAEPPPQMPGMRMPPPQRVPEFNQLEAFLSEDYNVVNAELEEGSVPGNVDVLLLLAPKQLSEKAAYAIDQFLMQGGTVIAASSPYSVNLNQQGLSLERYDSGLEQLMEHYGFSIEKSVVMDPNNASFPMPVMRDLGGFQVREIRRVDYPYFIDIREDGFAQDDPLVSGLSELVLTWASPLLLGQDESRQNDSASAATDMKKITPFVFSSNQAWLNDSTNVMPDFEASAAGFQRDDEGQQYALAAYRQGSFESYFADKPNPLLASDAAIDNETSSTNGDEQAADDADSELTISGTLKRSTPSAEFILIASNDFARDQLIQILSSAQGSQYLASLQLIQNAVDKALDDTGLASIRARGQFNRTLPPLEPASQKFWEYLNYILALVGLVIVYLIRRYKNKRAQQYYARAYA